LVGLVLAGRGRGLQKKKRLRQRHDGRGRPILQSAFWFNFFRERSQPRKKVAVSTQPLLQYLFGLLLLFLL
jgi:hypothetical protein